MASIFGNIVNNIVSSLSKGSSSSKSSSSSSSSSSSKSSSSSSSSSKKNPSTTDKPQYYKPGKNEEVHEGTAVIKNPDGSIKDTFPTYIKDGAMYDKETGKIVSSSHGPQGMYGDPESYDKHWDPETATGTWVEKEKPKKKPSGGGGGGGGYSPPPKPSFISFNEPVPTFKSDLKKVNKFTYFSGIDSIEAKRLETNPEVCFISKSVSIGTLKDNEYIELDAKYYCDDASTIEFYIIDGEREIPILPVGDSIIQNEKIFFNMDTRFPIDKEKPVLIKQGVRATNLSFNEANTKATDSKMENAYNITYTPKTSHKYKPFNQVIKIKVIIRSYEINKYSPYIKSMKIRKYGGNTLWNQNS